MKAREPDFKFPAYHPIPLPWLPCQPIKRRRLPTWMMTYHPIPLPTVIRPVKLAQFRSRFPVLHCLIAETICRVFPA